MKLTRFGGRSPGELRPCKITKDFIAQPPGSAIIETGQTKVICTASVVTGVPDFLDAVKQGWLTAEYGMLPGSTTSRKRRDRNGRTAEIQRLIGRSLRAVSDMTKWPGHTVYIDCDVIQADGGTRTASITGAYVALARAIEWMQNQGIVKDWPLTDHVAAVSVGIVQGVPLLDLDYSEDAAADVDVNVVMTGKGKFIEVQGTAENAPFTMAQLERMLALAKKGIKALIALQEEVLK